MVTSVVLGTETGVPKRGLVVLANAPIDARQPHALVLVDAGSPVLHLIALGTSTGHIQRLLTVIWGAAVRPVALALNFDRRLRGVKCVGCSLYRVDLALHAMRHAEEVLFNV